MVPSGMASEELAAAYAARRCGHIKRRALRLGVSRRSKRRVLACFLGGGGLRTGFTEGGDLAGGGDSAGAGGYVKSIPAKLASNGCTSGGGCCGWLLPSVAFQALLSVLLPLLVLLLLLLLVLLLVLLLMLPKSSASTSTVELLTSSARRVPFPLPLACSVELDPAALAFAARAPPSPTSERDPSGQLLPSDSSCCCGGGCEGAGAGAGVDATTVRSPLLSTPVLAGMASAIQRRTAVYVVESRMCATRSVCVAELSVPTSTPRTRYSPLR